MSNVDFSAYQDKYNLGKGDFRNFNEGIEKEWLISNGIGGYANSTVIGSNSRSFSSLLNVSLNHPTDRYTLLANISERISDDTGITNLATYHSISETYEGFRYLSHFSFGSYPEYTYQIGDMIIRKSIGMVYGKNTSVICYSVKNGSNNRKLYITPYFTCKTLGEVADPMALGLHSAEKSGTITITSDVMNMKYFFRASDGEFIDRSTYPISMAEPTHIYLSGVLYDLDVRNGLNACDGFYTPYDICIDINAGEDKFFYFVCSTEDVSCNGFDILKSMDARKKELYDLIPKKDGLLKRLAYSADNFIVERESTKCKTVLAGLLLLDLHFAPTDLKMPEAF